MFINIFSNDIFKGVFYSLIFLFLCSTFFGCREFHRVLKGRGLDEFIGEVVVFLVESSVLVANFQRIIIRSSSFLS